MKQAPLLTKDCILRWSNLSYSQHSRSGLLAMLISCHFPLNPEALAGKFNHWCRRELELAKEELLVAERVSVSALTASQTAYPVFSSDLHESQTF